MNAERIPPRPRLRRYAAPAGAPRAAGFSLVELMVGVTIVLVASLVGAIHTTQRSQALTRSKESAFARQRAVSILGELRAFVQGDANNTASELDEFDDGADWSPVLTITPDRSSSTGLVAPDHPISQNLPERGGWAWARRIEVRPLGNAASRDLRLATVRVYRTRQGVVAPGELMGEASSVIRTLGEAYPTTQVYDIYLLALENAPGWWVNLDVMQPFMQAALQDIQARNPGLEFRTHWITKLDYGRDEEYAPYTNEERTSVESTPWAYVYPGRLPDGEAAVRYYVPRRMAARVNLDGASSASFVNGYSLPEPFVDANGSGDYDQGESFTDSNGSGSWDQGNAVPYALADMHNHGMRWPDAKARFDARVAAGLGDAEAPPWRLLLDEMIADPTRRHNSIVVNLHGELLPMPPVRNFSDAASDPEVRPGWRVVTHPELLRPARVAGSDTATQAPRFRVYAYKTEFPSTEVVTTQREPLADADGNGVWDAGEAFTDWNGNGAWDEGLPITVAILGGNFAQAPNAATNPSIRVRRLRGGVDADGSGAADAYQAWDDAPTFPEIYTDANGDKRWQRAEPWLDLDGDGTKDAFEPWTELDGDGVWTAASETLTDGNGNGTWDPAAPAEPFTDANANGKWDGAEPYYDWDGNGVRTAPTSPKTPVLAWDPRNYGNPGQTSSYVKFYGEPYRDLDADGKYDGAEAFTDLNGNGRWDGGVRRGEMWYEIAWQANPARTVVTLHGTPLETPYESSTQRGLPTTERLYDLDYIPCPTPATSTDANRFSRDLYTAGSAVPKNTARWTIELPPPAVRRGFETASGANNGDAADRVIAVETRLGRDLATGTMWPTRRKPANGSRTYAWFHASASTVPFSERYQFLGDPRHSPYADTDRQGTTAVHGYNWCFDDFSNSSTNAQGKWLAFDGTRMDDGWLARGSGHDVPRLMAWLRQALVASESVYTTLTGFSYYYMSVGGDVGADSANGFANSIPMDGTPFGLSGLVNENTIMDGTGTSSIRGSLKYARSNAGSTTAGVRSGGIWWEKPWLGELCPDSAYASQWVPWGNLRAATGTTAGTFRMIPRGSVPSVQQPAGTTLANLYARLADEGCTAFFNIGTSTSTFHHQYQEGKTGALVEDGPQLAANYALAIPSPSAISRPFGLATSAAGGVGPEFSYTDAYPRFSAQIVRKFFDHSAGQTGSALVRLQEPGTAPRGAHVVVNGIDRTTSSGSAFISRYAVVTLVHGFLAAGAPSLPNRVKQVPQVQLVHPTLTTEIVDPASITVRWNVKWTRWDGRAYTSAYPTTYADAYSGLRFVLMASTDGGETWTNLRDGLPATPGELPWINGVGPDPARTLAPVSTNGQESWTWPTPDDRVGQGAYLLRVEAYRAAERQHYAYHMEKVYVDR